MRLGDKFQTSFFFEKKQKKIYKVKESGLLKRV